MDSMTSWERYDSEKLEATFKSNCNLRVCVDGGFRSRDLAAAGFVIYGARERRCGEYAYEMVYRTGLLVIGAQSAFVTEALALEMALTKVSKFLEDLR
eukprot:10938530-Karenia_brevis.AAC.1